MSRMSKKNSSVEALTKELDAHRRRWRLVWLHPECAQLLAREALFGAELEYDEYGHPTKVKGDTDGI